VWISSNADTPRHSFKKNDC